MKKSSGLYNIFHKIILARPTLFIFALAVLGVVFVFAINAAGYTVSQETETGTRAGGVAIINDTSASSGQAIQFGQTSTPLQRIMLNAPYFGTSLYWPTSGANYPTQYSTHSARAANRKPDMLRTFGRSDTGVWTWSSLQGGSSGSSSPTVTGHDGGNWHSFKGNLAAAATGSQNSAWTTSTKTIPVDGRPKLITIHHEPENDIPVGADGLPTTGSNEWILNWIKANIEIGRSVKAANHPDVLFGPILMSSYYIDGVPQTNPRNLHYIMKVASDNGLLDDMNQVFDFIGWDPYHEGSLRNPPKIAAPLDDAKYYFDKPYSFTQQYFPGKVFAIGETGYSINIPEASRVAWLKTVKSWVDNHPGKVLAVCYYDAQLEADRPWYLGIGPGGTLSEPYQTNAIGYWGSLYR